MYNTYSLDYVKKMVLLPKKLLSTIVVNANIIWFREKKIYTLTNNGQKI